MWLLCLAMLASPTTLSRRGDVVAFDGGFQTAEGGALTLLGDHWLLQLGPESRVELEGFIVRGEARLEARRPIKLKINGQLIEAAGSIWLKGGAACGEGAAPLPPCGAPLPPIRFDWPAPQLRADALPPPPKIEALREGQRGEGIEAGGESACLDSGDGGGEAAGEGAALPDADLEGGRGRLELKVRWSP